MAKQINNKQILDFVLGNKTVLWISDGNRYVLTDKLPAQILTALSKKVATKKIAAEIAIQEQLSVEEAQELVNHVKKIWDEQTLDQDSGPSFIKNSPLPGTDVFSRKRYEIEGIMFQVEYETANAEGYNHPKFAHLEKQKGKVPSHFIRVGDNGKLLSIWIDGVHSGSWKREENHFLSGRFSMKIVEKIYRKEEAEWMGVFHAAGISNGTQCLLFYGESGSGKSTLSALAMAAGFDVLADDFLPVESKSGLVHRFPAALSIKKNAYNLVKKNYPELLEGREYNNPVFEKTYRYLSPRDLRLAAVPCKAIIKVKYDAEVSFDLRDLPAEDAFATLVPDSWINASAENAKNFVVWFGKKKHYELRYSDNRRMIAAIKTLLDETV